MSNNTHTEPEAVTAPDTTAERADWARKAATRATATRKPSAPKRASIKPPSWLSAAGRAHFQPTIKLLHAHVDLLSVDADAVALYAEALARYLAIREIADTTPLMDLTPSGLRQHTIHRQLAEATSLLSKLGQQLGASPASRKHLKAPEPERAATGALLRKKGFAT